MTPPTMLGYLARFASFTMQSEVLCTQALTYLLNEYEEAHVALASEVESRTGVRINGELKWIAEALQADGGRPDLEAQTVDEKTVPVVKIEAKLGAELLPAQLWSYVKDLLKRNGGQSVLLVLVPKARTAGIVKIINKTFPLSGSDPWRETDELLSGSVAVSIISWDELFATLQGRKAERFQYELEQLKAMYYELRSDVIAPLASDQDLRQWRLSETDFVKLVDQVTRRLTTCHRLYPTQTESFEQASPVGEPVEYRFRYVCPCTRNTASCYSIGVRDSFEKYVTPIWMRFHRETGDFSSIRQRIESSNVKSLQSGGHVWIPLKVPRDVLGEDMVEALCEQAEEILRVAYAAG